MGRSDIRGRRRAAVLADTPSRSSQYGSVGGGGQAEASCDGSQTQAVLTVIALVETLVHPVSDHDLRDSAPAGDQFCRDRKWLSRSATGAYAARPCLGACNSGKCPREVRRRP